MFGRVIFVTSIIAFSFSVFNIIYIERNLGGKLFDIAVILFFCATQVLSGSKAGLLFCIFGMFSVIHFSRKMDVPQIKEKKIKKWMLILLLTSIPIGIMTIVTQNNDDTTLAKAFSILMLRFVNTGDIYYLSWVNDIVGQFSGNYSEGVTAIFSDILGALRLYPRSELPAHLGLQVMWAVNGGDAFDGPNLRHNVFGIFYFGIIGAIMYSFFLGYLVGYIRKRLYLRTNNSLVSMAFYCIIFNISSYISQDFSSLAMSYFFSTILIFPLLLSISALFSQFKK